MDFLEAYYGDLYNFIKCPEVDAIEEGLQLDLNDKRNTGVSDRVSTENNKDNEREGGDEVGSDASTASARCTEKENEKEDEKRVEKFKGEDRKGEDRKGEENDEVEVTLKYCGQELSPFKLNKRNGFKRKFGFAVPIKLYSYS